MANVSQIKLPNGTAYSVKDNSGEKSNHIHDSTSLVPIQSKTYTGVIASANSDPAAYFYFAKIVPTTYQTPWKVKYKLYCTISGITDGYQVSYITIYGCKNTYYAYQTHNIIPNTSYRPIYYHLFYSAKQAGITGNYGHLLGLSLRYSYNPATVANARTIMVDILETDNCNVTFFDSMTLYANVPGTGSTNYNSRVTFDATTQGYTETGDRNDTNANNRENYGIRTTSTALYRYQFCLTKLDGTLVPVNSVNNSVATNKTLTTDSFNPFGDIFYWNSTTTYNANANVGDNNWYRQVLADLRYSFNVGGYDVASTLTARQPLYLVCNPQSDGSAVLHSSPLSQTLPNSEDGLLYIYLGRIYPDTYPYRVALNLIKPVYWYKNGAIRPYVQEAQTVNGHTVGIDVPANAKFTDTITTATTSGSGNAVTAITASNGALTITKGTTFLTSHQDISGKADKSATVSTVTWDSTNKKLTKTINGTTSDVVTAATLRTGLNVADGAEVNQNAFSNIKVGSTTVAADSKTDTLELAAGTNITLTPDATNDKVTIASDCAKVQIVRW